MATQAHTHWKKLSNPDYLGSYAFDPGEEKTATINYVRQELVTGPDGKKEQCIVAHFVEDMKPMILNATNCKTITNLFHTPYIEEWSGKKISMHVEQVKAFGDLVDAVRIMKKLSSKGPSAPKCEECGKAIAGIGNFSAEQVAATNKQRYGKCLCVECGKKRAAEIEAEKNASVQEEPGKREMTAAEKLAALAEG